MTMTRLPQGLLPQQLVAFAGRALRGRLGILASPLRDMHEAQRVVTIGLPQETVREFFAAPGRLAQVLPAPGEVSAVGEDRTSARPGDRESWQVTPGPDTPPAPDDGVWNGSPPLSWQVTSTDGALADITVRLSDAPAGLGTEATMRVRYVSGGPADTRPGPVSQAHGGESAPPPVSAAVLAIRGLRNARALMETGEIPTLRGNPAHRPGEAPGGGQDAREHQTDPLDQPDASPDQPDASPDQPATEKEA